MHQSELFETVIDLFDKHGIKLVSGCDSLDIIDDENFRESSSNFYYDAFQYGIELETIGYALKNDQ
ncbi:hypothetical protein P5704_024310 (plasmid) [Pseudomonas sp. FeN3W]|nr:hypothetical protein P5704_024310 [Pseudomonas sp. FeN3W]